MTKDTSMRPTERFRLVRRPSIGLLIALIALTGCAADVGAPRDDEGFWSQLRIDGDEAEGFDSIESMYTASDAVVLGSIVRISESRIIQGDAAEDRVGYVLAEIQVERILRGEIGKAPVPLELLAPGMGGATGSVAALAQAIPDGPMVIFLRAKRGDGEAGLYRVVNSWGLWAATTRQSVDTPLSVQAPSGNAPYQMDGVTSLESLVDLLLSFDD